MGQVEYWSALKTTSLTKILVIRQISACLFHDERFVCANLRRGSNVVLSRPIVVWNSIDQKSLTSAQL